MTTFAALLLASLAAADPAGAPPPRDAADLAADGDQRPQLKFPSLLAAESLRGGSGLLAKAGFSTLGVAFGQGLTLQDDLGLTADLDWAATQLVLAGYWKRTLGSMGTWDLAGRLSLGWYLDFGATWIHDDNRGDRGFAAAPSLILSTRAGDGVVSLTGELPIIITARRGGGFLVAPKVSGAYEAPLYGPWTLGISGGLWWRGGGGGAPMRSGRLSPELLVLAGYRLF